MSSYQTERFVCKPRPICVANRIGVTLSIRWMLFLLVFVSYAPKLLALSGGRTDRLKGAPFYISYGKKVMLQDEAVGSLPVGIDENSKSEFFYAGRAGVLQPLIEAIDTYLDSLNRYKRLELRALPEKGVPSVYVGSSEGESAPPSASLMRTDYEKYPPMIVHVQSPSGTWRKALANLAHASQLDYVLAISLASAEYPKADRGLFGKKVVLGTDYEHKIRFLSAEDKPVEVLQVAGILMDKEGKILKAGAEGILHEDTPFWVQVLELKKVIDDRQISNLLTDYRREDLPGQPLAWKVALNNLLINLHSSTQAALSFTSH